MGDTKKKNGKQPGISPVKKIEKTLDSILTFLDSFPHLVMVVDTESWKILFVNGLMAKSLGRGKKELLDKNLWEIFPKNVASERKKQALTAMQTGKTIHFEDQREGRWFSNQYIPLKDKTGKVIYGATISKETTQQKNLEEQFKSFLDQSLMGVAILQEDHVRYLNDAFTIITGYKKDELFKGGISFLRTLLHPEDAPFAINQLKKNLLGKTTKISRYPVRIRSKKRGFIWVEIFSKTIKYNGNNAAFLTFIDITQLKQSEEELRHNEERYHSIFNISVDGIILTTPDGTIKDVNKAALRIMGYRDKKEVIGRSYSEFYVQPEERKKIVEELLLKGYVEDHEFFLRKKNGSPICTRGSCAVKKYDEKDIEYIVCTFRDITEQKQISEHIKKSQTFLQNVLDGTSEVIFSLDASRRVTSWNRSAVITTGYEKRDVIGKLFSEVPLFKNHAELYHVFQSLMDGHTCPYEDLIFRTKFDADLIIRPSYSLLKSSTNEPSGLIVVGKDVTKETSISGRLRPGHSYCIEDTSPNEAVTIFLSHVSKANKGLFFSRTTTDQTKRQLNKPNIQSVVIGRKTESEGEDCPSLKELGEKITHFVQKNPHAVIFLSRIEYFMLMSSFDDLINTLYTINSRIASSKSILIVRINPNIIRGKELEIVREEFEPIVKKTLKNVQLDEDLFNILKYINHHNVMNRLLTYTNISKKFNITKITTAKRLTRLEHMGLISIKVRGRSKTIHITDDGKDLLLE